MHIISPVHKMQILTYSFVSYDRIRSVENVRDAEGFQTFLVECRLHAAQVNVFGDLRGQHVVQMTACFVLIRMRQS